MHHEQSWPEARETAARRFHAICSLRRYFGEAAGEDLLSAAPEVADKPKLTLRFVDLPDWALGSAANGPKSIPVDASCILSGPGPEHERCDWWSAAFLYLDGWLERSIEKDSGSLHSYAARIPPEWSAAYDRAWVNRIGLYMRMRIARMRGLHENELFGPLPHPRIVLTHDVDALTKTVQLRIKTGVMAGLAASRLAMSGRVTSAVKRVVAGSRFVLTSSSYDLFGEICAQEEQRGFRSIFFLADRTARRGPRAWLIDPSYSANEPLLQERMSALRNRGWGLGMHPGFETWNDVQALATTRTILSSAAGQEIRSSRQHWLRFSWQHTWAALAQAGILIDYTLGFNDRPGFRAGAALAFRPWDHDASIGMPIEAMPTVFMDSHFYDYAFPEEPMIAMAPWIDEIIAVRGEASVIWHSQTMHPEYGWASGYLALLDYLSKRGVEASV